MPVEGQWRRVNTPLSRRDKYLVAAVAGISAIAAVVIGIAFAYQSASSSNAGCVVVDVPSTMGGARLRNCGAAAHAFCHTQGRLDVTVAAACRRLGYAAHLRR